MKVALVLILVAYAMAQPANLTGLHCSNVIQKNTIQEYLQIEFLANVSLENACGNEFAAYGSCCSASSLRKQATRLNASLTRDVQALKREYVEFSAAVASVNQELKDLIDSREEINDQDATSKVAKARAFRDSKVFSFLRTYFPSTSAGSDDFNSSLDKCWGEVARARNSSLCILCSGRSPAFVTSSEQLVISNLECSGIANKCRDSINNLRTFAQALSFYVNVMAPVLASEFNIFVDISRVNRIGLAGLEAALAGDRIESGLSGTGNTADGIICEATLSAGRATAVEAMAHLFNSQAEYTVFNLRDVVSQNSALLVNRTEELEDKLTAKFTFIPQPPAEPRNATVNALIAAVLNTFRNFENNRRRRLQVIGGRLDTSIFRQYVEKLDVILFGKVRVNDHLLTPTFVRTTSDLTLGNTYDEYLSSLLAILNQELFSQSVSGSIGTVAYSNPQGTNVPAYNRASILQPIMLTPLNLVI